MQVPRTSRYDRDTVDDLVYRVGPRALVNKEFAFWPYNARDPLPGLYSLEAWSDRSQAYELRRTLTGRSHPVPAGVGELYIGEKSRHLDDPLIELLFLNDFDPTRFLAAARGLPERVRSGGGYRPPDGRESRGPPVVERWGFGSPPRRSVREEEAPRGRPLLGDEPLEGSRRRGSFDRKPEGWVSGGGTGGGPPERGRAGAELPPEVLKRIEALEKSREEAAKHASASEYAAAELARMQSNLSPQTQKGLHCQMDMFQSIYRAPDCHQGLLSLGGGLSTDIKGLSLKFGFLGELTFAKARQLCWAAGPSFGEEKRREIEDKIMEFYRQQRAEAERLYGKNPQLYAKDGNNKR